MARAGLSGAILALLAVPAWAAPLQIVVTNIQNSKGDIRVAVCKEQEFLQQHCSWNGTTPAHPGQVTIVLEVPPGFYAVQAYHDEDRSGDVTLSLLGLPEEPMGFSNNPTIRFSAPRFRDSSFQVGAMGGRIEVVLKKLF